MLFEPWSLHDLQFVFDDHREHIDHRRGPLIHLRVFDVLERHADKRDLPEFSRNALRAHQYSPRPSSGSTDASPRSISDRAMDSTSSRLLALRPIDRPSSLFRKSWFRSSSR